MSKMEKGTTTAIRLSMCTWLSVVCNTLLAAWVKHICTSSCVYFVSVVQDCSRGKWTRMVVFVVFVNVFIFLCF